jgi:hypothetical protein
MAIEDYFNFFGGTPTMYQGLLNPKDQAALERRANIGGLLSAAGALAQGMSPQGYRRSPIQNVLTALGAGFTGAGQTFESGINQMANVQKLQQSQAQMQAINQLLQDPRIAKDPMMVAYIRANPAEAIKYFAEMAPLQQALTGAPSAAPAVPSAAPVLAAPAITTEGAAPVVEGQRLDLVEVQGKERPDPFLARKQQLLGQNDRLSTLPTKTARDIIANNLQQIETLDKQISKRAVETFDFAKIKAGVPDQFKLEVDDLQQLAASGGITGNDLRQGLQDINKRASEFVSKEKDYTNEDRRVAAKLFPNKSIRELSSEEIARLDDVLYNRDIQKKMAGRTVIDMGTREMEKEFAKGVVEDTRSSFQQAKAAMGTIKTINTLKPIISAGVYEGVLAGAPRAIDQFATALGISGKDTQEKLQRTSVAMQRLASLELQAAEAMKGQGAITENERALIARAAGGNLRDFTATEVQALLSSLDTVARFKVDSHQSNWQVMNEDPIGKKYSKYYKLGEVPPPVSETPVQQSAPSGVTVRKIR